ncbi:unnamed protein product [Owenia fusiformis]|uniref:Uncharacterized protein n=1 Tax=Owenia fusiformis TaxID=6347 RepID=A0A8J1UGF7_OWEFU|nr:unnamed protein product [Owenia fusiformis]
MAARGIRINEDNAEAIFADSGSESGSDIDDNDSDQNENLQNDKDQAIQVGGDQVVPDRPRRHAIPPDNGQYDWHLYDSTDPYEVNWIQEFNIPRRGGVLVNTDNFTPYDYFKIFYPDELLTKITDETNNYAFSHFDVPGGLDNFSPRSRLRQWELRNVFLVTEDESVPTIKTKIMDVICKEFDKRFNLFGDNLFRPHILARLLHPTYRQMIEKLMSKEQFSNLLLSLKEEMGETVASVDQVKPEPGLGEPSLKKIKTEENASRSKDCKEQILPQAGWNRDRAFFCWRAFVTQEELQVHIACADRATESCGVWGCEAYS